jgi:FixJ family two-component response regulator
MAPEGRTVAIIDDDGAVRRSLCALFESAGFAAMPFALGEDFLLQRLETFDCVVADLRMPGLSGLDLVQRCKADQPSLPVVVVTAHGDVEMAVEAMKHGAADFMEKPCEPKRLIDAVSNAIEGRHATASHAHGREDVLRRIETLSHRERDVLRRLLVRSHNKVVAGELGISVRTVEIHRSRILSKLGADGLPDLVRIVLSSGVTV